MSALSIFDPVYDAPQHQRPALHVVPAPATGAGHLRLTQRGRIVVVLAGLALALLLGIVLAASVAATSQPLQTRSLQVGPGDTLWGIAAAVPGTGDVRDTMAEIKQLNHLTSSGLAAGQVLRVPTTR